MSIDNCHMSSYTFYVFCTRGVTFNLERLERACKNNSSRWNFPISKYNSFSRVIAYRIIISKAIFVSGSPPFRNSKVVKTFIASIDFVGRYTGIGCTENSSTTRYSDKYAIFHPVYGVLVQWLRNHIPSGENKPVVRGSAVIHDCGVFPDCEGAVDIR